MSQLTNFLQMQQEAERLQEEMKRLQESDALKRELEFKELLEASMKEYDMSAADVLNMLDPQRLEQPKQESQGRERRKRKLKIYKNPHTGETVETRGGNQKTLKAWKEEYGTEEVEGWLVDEVA